MTADDPAKPQEAAQPAAPDPSREEFIAMGRRASDEIKNLRARLDNLAPKAQAYDAINHILDLLPQRSMGEGEDIAWRIDQRIAELTRK